MGQICCKCGKSESVEKIVDGFCLSCYSEEHPLILFVPEKEFLITACKLCGDLMHHNKWVEVVDDPKSVMLTFLDEYISKIKKVKGTKKILVSYSPEPSYAKSSRQKMAVLFEGSPHDEILAYQQEFIADFIVNLGVCPRCAKFTRGYFEAIIQIRSNQRVITEEEQERISNLIKAKADEKILEDRMAYITKTIDQTRGGLDLYVGSDSFAKTLVDYLVGNLAASVDFSNKLKTMKDGKNIYQSTYCVRLPQYEIGDIVKFQKQPQQVLGINFGRVVLFNIITHETRTLSLKESQSDLLEILKKKNQFKKHIIVTLQPSTAAVMNTTSFETIDVKREFILENHKEGDEILMVELKGEVYECNAIN